MLRRVILLGPCRFQTVGHEALGVTSGAVNWEVVALGGHSKGITMGNPGQRTISRSEYASYIASAAWRATRERYWSSKLPSCCYCCGRPRHAGMHLHHRTYKNLGNERLMDLVPLCESCHQEVHYLHKNDPKCKRLGLWYATKRARKIKQRDYA